MKFDDNSKKMNISLFVIICFMLANYNSILASEIDTNINNNISSLKEFSASSFLSMEEKNKEMSEDMQFQNLFVIK